MNLVVKLFLFILLIATATALQCYSCSSKEIGVNCITNNNTSKWTTTTCLSNQTACYIWLRKDRVNSTTGVAERGCASNMNYCNVWMNNTQAIEGHKNCYICNTATCNSINALNMTTQGGSDGNSSTTSSFNILLLIVPLLLSFAVKM
uniref:Putative conserved secreted protein n=1 Tax=Nyssomyia neivai TaxID=330878 RepID=A0A1L8DP76_9DIPT